MDQNQLEWSREYKGYGGARDRGLLQQTHHWFSHLQYCSALPAVKFNPKAVLLLRFLPSQSLGNSAKTHDPQAEDKFIQADPIFTKPAFLPKRPRISGVIHSCAAAPTKNSSEMHIKRHLKTNNSS